MQLASAKPIFRTSPFYIPITAIGYLEQSIGPEVRFECPVAQSVFLGRAFVKWDVWSRFSLSEQLTRFFECMLACDYSCSKISKLCPKG